MSQHPVSAPWTPEVQRLCLVRCYEEYVRQNGDPRPPQPFYHWVGTRYERVTPRPVHQPNLPHLWTMYRIGRDSGELKLHYDDFQDQVLSGIPGYRYAWGRYGVRKSPDYRNWYPIDGAHFRQKVPLRIPDPKVPDETEIRRREWRDRKGFQRNRGPHWGIKARGFCRRVGNRALRRWERRVIQSGEYHELADERSTLRLYLDPWDWD